MLGVLSDGVLVLSGLVRGEDVAGSPECHELGEPIHGVLLESVARKVLHLRKQTNTEVRAWAVALAGRVSLWTTHLLATVV